MTCSGLCRRTAAPLNAGYGRGLAYCVKCRAFVVPVQVRTRPRCPCCVGQVRLRARWQRRETAPRVP